MLGPQGFIAYTEAPTELIEEHLLGHHMYADDGTLDDEWYSECCYEAPELHWSHIGLVQFKKASAESNKDQADLVRIQDKFEENRR